MKIKICGLYRKGTESSQDGFPSNAVPYKGFGSLQGQQFGALFFQVPLFVFLAATIVIVTIIDGVPPNHFVVQTFVFGCIVGLLLTPAHELLHAITFPRSAVVEMWVSLRFGMLFISSTTPLSKFRNIVATLLPAAVLGVVPFIIWVLFFPQLTFLLGIAFFSISASAGDFVDVICTLRQVPSGGMVVDSRLGTYWYLETP